MNEKILSEINAKLEAIQQERRRKWLDVAQTANYLCISVSKVRKLISAGKIPYNRVDGKIVFHIRKLDLWTLNNGKKNEFSKSDRKLLEVLE